MYDNNNLYNYFITYILVCIAHSRLCDIYLHYKIKIC